MFNFVLISWWCIYLQPFQCLLELSFFFFGSTLNWNTWPFISLVFPVKLCLDWWPYFQLCRPRPPLVPPILGLCPELGPLGSEPIVFVRSYNIIQTRSTVGFLVASWLWYSYHCEFLLFHPRRSSQLFLCWIVRVSGWLFSRNLRFPVVSICRTLFRDWSLQYCNSISRLDCWGCCTFPWSCFWILYNSVLFLCPQLVHDCPVLSCPALPSVVFPIVVAVGSVESIVYLSILVLSLVHSSSNL